MNKKILSVSILGNALEFYDFALFGIFSTLFARIFFVEQDQFTGLLSSLCVFAAGLLMRPIGGILFGHFGDKIGRKKVLSYSIICMAFPTLLIGLLPTYAAIGVAAPALLTLYRLFQGLCTGGEDSGSVVFLLEHTEKKNSGIAGAFILTGSGIGTVIAMFMGFLTLQPGMPEWAWRIPFMLGFSIGFLGFYIRLKMPETPEYTNNLDAERTLNLPIKDVLSHYPHLLIITAVLSGFGASLAYTLVVYLSIHLTNINKISLGDSILYGMYGFALYSFIVPMVGKLSDHVGKPPIMLLGLVLTSIFIYPTFLLLESGHPVIFILLICCFMACFNGPRNAYVNDFFPVRCRYSGIGFSSSIGIAIFGGGMPIISSLLVRYTGDSAAPAYYLIFMSVIGGIALLSTLKASALQKYARSLSRTVPLKKLL